MPFMFVILVFLLYMVVWALFHYNPKGVPFSRVLVYNVVLLIVAIFIGAIAGAWIYEGAIQMPEKRHMLWYLTIMAGGAAFMIAVAVGGMVRNFLVFPLRHRTAEGENAAREG